MEQLQIGHGSVPTFVERPTARYEQTIRAASAHRLLADPIDFAQNMAHVIECGMLSDLLMHDAPQQIEDHREQFEFMIENVIRRQDMPAITETFRRYTEFVTYALTDAHEYGVAMGAVMEHLRVGLSGGVDLQNRGLTKGDMGSIQDLQNLRRKYDLRSRAEDPEAQIAETEGAGA